MSTVITNKVADNEWKITTKFIGDQRYSQLIIRLAPLKHKGKHTKFFFRIPSKGTPSTMNAKQIVWRSTGNEGLSRSFGEFLKNEMEKVVVKWKRVEQMRDWVENKKDEWKKKVRRDWNKKCSRRPRTRQQ